MGQDQSKLTDEIGEKYTIVKTISEGEYLVKRQKKGDELQLRVLSFLIEDEMQQYISLLDRRKKIKNPHLLQLVEYSKVVSQLMCSSTFKLKIVSERPFKTLKQVINERIQTLTKRYFAQDQLWSILYSSCHALYGLYINRIPHQSLTISQIYIDIAGIIKIADPILVNGTKNYLSLMNQQSKQSQLRYISPQLRNLVDDNNFYQYDKQKSDVFILAMIILEIGLLNPLKYYDVNTKRFNFQIIRSSMDMFQERYSRKFTQIIERMLVFDYNIRPTFAQIIQSVEEKTVRTNSNTSSKQSSVLIEYSKQDQKNLTYPKKSDLNTVKERLNFDIPPQTVTSKPIYSIPPNNFHNQTLPPQTNSLRIIPQAQLPITTFTVSNYVPNIAPQQPNSVPNPSLIHKIPEPQRIQTIPVAPVWKFDTILKNVKADKETTYTPYQNLAEYSGNSSIPNTYSNPQKEQTTNKPFANDHFKPLQAPRLEHLTLNTYDFSKQRRFSEAKFGGIELGNTTTQKKNNTEIPLISQKNQIKQPPAINLVSRSSRTEQQSMIQNGIFVIQENQNGKYQGFKEHHQKNGIGRITYVDGGFYQGQWKNDRMDGFGKLYYPNGNPAYEGYWLQDEFNGTGRVYNDISEDENTAQEIDYKDLDDLENKWVYYQGQFYKDLRHGKGIIKFFTGEKFIGNFKQDIIDGEGSFYRKDGDIVHGIWRNNKFTSIE